MKQLTGLPTFVTQLWNYITLEFVDSLSDRTETSLHNSFYSSNFQSLLIFKIRVFVKELMQKIIFICRKSYSNFIILFLVNYFFAFASFLHTELFMWRTYAKYKNEKF